VIGASRPHSLARVWTVPNTAAANVLAWREKDVTKDARLANEHLSAGSRPTEPPAIEPPQRMGESSREGPNQRSLPFFRKFSPSSNALAKSSASTTGITFHCE
jgi:hypothetical protein